MISYPIKELKKSKIFSKIFVSTESDLIKKIAIKYGANVDFLRPKELSKDKVPLNLVLKNVLLQLEKRGEIFDEVWMVYACNPLLNKTDIIKANNKFQKTSKNYPMMSMKQFEAPIEWAFKKKGDIFQSIDNKNLFKDSKKLKKKYFECASFVVYSKKHLESYKNFYKFYSYVMKNHQSIDIDSKSDWDYALKLYKISK